jgi:hypothetical protein
LGNAVPLAEVAATIGSAEFELASREEDENEKDIAHPAPNLFTNKLLRPVLFLLGRLKSSRSRIHDFIND